MHPAFFAIWLAALHQSMPVNCFPVQLDPSQPCKTIKGTSKRSESVDVGDNLLKVNLNGHVHKAIDINSLVVLPIRTETSDCVPIMDFKSKHFLCVDIEGKLFSSMDSRKECLFQQLQMENHVDLFYSSSNGLLLHLEGAKIHVKRHDLLKRHLVYRKKRSQQVNAENPEAEPIMSDQDMQQDQERAGAVSKETITSCDDPLRVLHSNSPGSPIKTAVEKTANE
ncbi:fibroblast growth factor 23 [Oncorhynchus tshawytscha]|uniref:Uncharacterized protein n=1 Tax=Oncorhynchus tshawytscha TaxID=74940 RepID=A0A8C8J583_ONCTS|nr:fibroblast growth factor 23 [Oncorhynchus tshawytscha]